MKISFDSTEIHVTFSGVGGSSLIFSRESHTSTEPPASAPRREQLWLQHADEPSADYSKSSAVCQTSASSLTILASENWWSTHFLLKLNQVSNIQLFQPCRLQDLQLIQDIYEHHSATSWPGMETTGNSLLRSELGFERYCVKIFTISVWSLVTSAGGLSCVNDVFLCLVRFFCRSLCVSFLLVIFFVLQHFNSSVFVSFQRRPRSLSVFLKSHQSLLSDFLYRSGLKRWSTNTFRRGAGCQVWHAAAPSPSCAPVKSLLGQGWHLFLAVSSFVIGGGRG